MIQALRQDVREAEFDDMVHDALREFAVTRETAVGLAHPAALHAGEIVAVYDGDAPFNGSVVEMPVFASDLGLVEAADVAALLPRRDAAAHKRSSGVVVAVVNGVSSGLSAYGIKVFPAAILGGLDSIGGAVLGGIIIGLLENIAQYVDSEYLHWGNLYEIAPFYVLIIILMIKPYGLFGTKDIERI